MMRRFFVVWVMGILATLPLAAEEVLEADLLIVGGNESGCAAAIQAARLGVERIVLTNDIDWLGGQFSAEAVGVVDEWTLVKGKRTHFPRSGLFAETLQRMRAINSRKFGLPNPGNAVCGTETIEPTEAAALFEAWLAEHRAQVRVLRPWQPARVLTEGRRVTGVVFETPGDAPNKKRIIVKARLTVDCSDWGDVIRLSGARYAAGIDLKARFGEPSAPDTADGSARNEMNPISWCLVVREAAQAGPIPRPPTYQARSFAALDKTVPWVDSAYPEGIYSITNQSIYTHRRLVDRWHNGLPVGTEKVLLNWPVQDYPLYDFPHHVTAALEATQAGASKKNIVDMTPAQRAIVFEDAKQHSLGFLYHLQTAVHDRVGDYPQSFRRMELTDEFGTPDRLPPKPYVREGLRLEALYMLREQDIRAADRQPRWARVMAPDGVFGFQFNIDFHPTRREFLDGDPAGPWRFVHTKNRNWHTDTDRAMFPLRGLIPVEMDGLLGGSKNIGVSSVVQSALRLHGQMMHVGQAVAHLAAMSLQKDTLPRDIAADTAAVRELQVRLVRGAGGPGLLLWPWQDLPVDAPHFEAANLLTLMGVWAADADSLHFHADRPVSRRELARALARLHRLTAGAEAVTWVPADAPPRFTDVPADDADRTFIESMIQWGKFGQQKETFDPAGAVNWGTLHRWALALGHAPSPALKQREAEPLLRGEAVRHLWQFLQEAPRLHGPAHLFAAASGQDADADGIPDLEDALPQDGDNDSLPDLLDPFSEKRPP
jgi:hypothetical protein